MVIALVVVRGHIPLSKVMASAHSAMSLGSGPNPLSCPCLSCTAVAMVAPFSGGASLTAAALLHPAHNLVSSPFIELFPVISFELLVTNLSDAAQLNQAGCRTDLFSQLVPGLTAQNGPDSQFLNP